MVSIAEILNSQRSSPVTYYPTRISDFQRPAPSYTPQPSYAAPSSRYTPPAPRPSPSPSGAATDWSALDNAAAAFGQQQQVQQQQQQAQQDSFWGHGFGKGLGFVINNPVTRVLTTPINYLQTGGRAATLGVEELAEALPGGDNWAQRLVGAVPGLGQLVGNVDVTRTEADKRSNWEKVFSPHTTYGYGELLNPDNPSYVNRIGGLLGDVALDPLTYVGGGATRTVEGASHLDEAMKGLSEATDALKAARAGGDAAEIAKAGERLAIAEDYVARAPQLGKKMWEVPLPRNRIERGNLLAELSDTAAGRKFLTEMPGEAARAGTRGFQTISPEAKQLLGIAEPGLRVRGLPMAIPGTGKIAEALNAGGGLVRQGLANIPGEAGRIRNVRTPKGLVDAYNVLTRDVDGDLFREASVVSGANQIRLGKGAQLGRGNRALVRGVREMFKGKSDDAIRTMVREAETLPEANGINDIASKLLGIYQKVTGRIIDPDYLRDPATYFPHMLDPKWRRTLARLSKRGDKAAQDFLEITGTLQNELLEDPAFYADNLLDGSGFLEKARVFGPDAEGNPQTFNIGGKEVTFEQGDVGHINDVLHEAFPTYKGDFYDTDPVRVFEAYNTSLARQAGRDLAVQNWQRTGNPLVKTMTGDIDATRKAMNESLSQQPASQILSTAQGKYDPTQPLPTIPEAKVVPGSAAEREPIQALRESAAQATDPGTKAVLEAEAARLEAGRTRFGEVNPQDYFVTTAGRKATEERAAQVTRAATYARAAAKETNVAEQTLRQNVYDLREMVVSPLKTAVKDMRNEIKTLNSRLRKWGKTVTDMGTLTVDNQDELADLLSKVEAEVTNAETKLRRTASSWKGRATRAQRKAESELRTSLENLKAVRDQAWEKARAAPRLIREEIEYREQILNQSVRDANEALLRAEMAVPVPHNQAAVDAAVEQLNRLLGQGDDPAQLLERYRGIIDDIRTGARGTVEAGAQDTDVMAHERAVYGALLDEIREIAGRKYRGKLSRANQELMDEAVAKRNALALALGQAQTAGGAAGKLSPYDEAMSQLADLRVQIRNAERGGVGAAMTAEEQRALIERYARGEVGLDALGKGATPGDLPRLRADRNKLARMFRPGGKFYEEAQARDVVKNMQAYDADVMANTATEREAVASALKERNARQEAIIWKSERARRERTGRWAPFYGERPGIQEELGRGLGESRIVEPIEKRPQGKHVFATAEYGTTPEGELTARSLPQPRTEAEAIESLRSLEATGGPAAMAARGQGRRLNQQVVEAETSLPTRIGNAQARIAMEYGVQRDQELGPLAARAQTYTNLASDLSDKQNLVVKRNEARALVDQVKADPTWKRTDVGQTLDDIEGVAKANPYLDDPKLNQVESLLQTHRQELDRISETRLRVADLDKVVDDANNGRLGKVMIATLNNNWRALHNGPINTGDVFMDIELHKRFTNLFEVSRQPKLLGRVFNEFTNLFKTYATLSPGFFVRNAIGGVFMNTADGVALTAQADGARLWRDFIKGGDDWLEKQPEDLKQAFAAAMASGAGGRYEDSGVVGRSANSFIQWAANNRMTRWAQRTGTHVEGAMRLGMAIDSIDKGLGMEGALQRITRVHFDYAQVSELDETMKRIIPFWTFMSRNLPLQIQEQWTNPRVYSYYNHIIKNFSLPDEKFTPDYWTRQGAWRTPVSIAGAPVYAQPDLGFTRMQSDIEMLSGALGGDNPGQMFAQANPLIGATLDFMNKRDSFYNRAYDPTDYSKMSGPIGTAISLLAKPLGQTNEAGQVSDNFTNYLQSLVPTLNQAIRLFPGAAGGDTSAQTWVKRARYAGVPMQLLTPDAQNSEYWRQWRAMQDEADRQQAMLKEAAS